MTATNNAEPSGEERLRNRRSKFWRYLGIVFVAFAIAGFLSGYLTDAYKSGDVPLWLPLAVVALTIVALIYYTRDYYRRVDELDLMDNLWAHMIGLYGAVIFYGAWYLIADLGVVSDPTALGVVLAAFVTTFAAYGLRKLGWR